MSNHSTLNIEYHRKRMILFALKHHKTRIEAAKALGITSRQLLNLENKYNNDNP